MGSKSKKPDPVPVSEGEKIQAKLAKEQIDYYRATYTPLEQKLIEDSKQDYSSRLSAQVGSAGMRQATEGLRSLALGSAPVDSADIAAGISDARVDAFAQGRRERDDARLDALGVGLGITADASKSLTEAGRIQTNAAIESVEAKLRKQQAKDSVKQAGFAAIGTLAGAVGTKALLDKRVGASVEAYSGSPQSSPVSLNSASQKLVATRGKPIW